MLNEITVQARDVEDVRYVLKACLMFLQARDLMEAQANLTTVRPSALTVEVERVGDRFQAYFGQFLIDKHEAELEGYGQDAEEDAEDDPEASESLPEASEDELSDAPLGSPNLVKQKGRVVSVEELTKKDDELEEDE